MSISLGGWIHSFTVTEANTHKKGYTVYKITSIVFPRSVPEALTCITVWKRFHDVKRLYREITKRHRNLNIRGHVPEPTDSSFFKRFDPDVIQSRKEYILQLLDFVAQHPALYKSHPFMQFFENGHTPNSSPMHREKGNIEEICDSIDLPYEVDFQLIDPKKADEESAILVESFVKEVSERLQPNANCPTKNPDYTKMLTPMASFESEDIDYFFEAALEFSRAVQAEVNLDYREAYEKYKFGVDTLLSGSKDDTNNERKYIAKVKVAKYMARADDIYQRFLLKSTDDSKHNFQLSIDISPNSKTDSSAVYLERPWNHLSKFKVIRIFDTVMQVQNVTDTSVNIMKGILKPSSNSPAQSVFLPQGVPYMVDLLSFFQSDEKILLLLRQAKGGKLFDYVKSYAPTTGINASVKDIFNEIEPEDDGKEKLDYPAQNMDTSSLVSYSQKLLQSVSKTLSDDVKKSETDTGTDHTIKKYALPEASVKQWARELLTAIESLHSKGVILRDLHSDNLLLGSKGELLLSYFYQTEGIEPSTHDWFNFKLSALDGHYVAPERPLTMKSDWWSFGVVLFELLTGVPFKTCHPGNMDMYFFTQFPNKEISEKAKDLLNGLLQKDPELRLDLVGVKKHAFFDGTNWEEMARNGINV